jgi:hypothetical protein
VRRLAAVVAAALALAACGGVERDGANPTLSPIESTTSPSTTASSSPTATGTSGPTTSPTPEPPTPPSIGLPPDAPTTFPGDAAAGDLPLLELVPPGAEVDATEIRTPPDVPTGQLEIVWSRGDDPFVRERGFALWMPFDDPARWDVVYAFTAPVPRGVLGIRSQGGDVTGDLVSDVLVVEDVGGSGACAVWRVVATADGTATEVFRRRTCDADLAIVGGDLELREAVFEPGDSHCCPSAYRTTTLAWDGSRFVPIDVTESPAPPS